MSPCISGARSSGSVGCIFYFWALGNWNFCEFFSATALIGSRKGEHVLVSSSLSVIIIIMVMHHHHHYHHRHTSGAEKGEEDCLLFLVVSRVEGVEKRQDHQSIKVNEHTHLKSNQNKDPRVARNLYASRNVVFLYPLVCACVCLCAEVREQPGMSMWQRTPPPRQLLSRHRRRSAGPPFRRRAPSHPF